MTIEETEPAAVEAMLRYLYQSDYDDENSVLSAPELNVLVLILADMCEIPPLCELAAEKFEACAAIDWSVASFAEAIKIVFTAAPQQDFGLRATIIDVVREHGKALYTEDKGAAFREVAETVAPFASALVKAVVMGAGVQIKKPANHSGAAPTELVLVSSPKGLVLVSYRCPVGVCGTVFKMEDVGRKTASLKFTCPLCATARTGQEWYDKCVFTGL